jgi:hypothetical protein
MRVGVEQGLRDHAAFGDRDGSEIEAARVQPRPGMVAAVADRVDARHAGSVGRIDADGAPRVHAHAELLEPEAAGIGDRVAPGGVQHGIGRDRAGGGVQHEPPAGRLEVMDRGARAHVQPAPPHLRGGGGAHVAVEPAQRLGAPDDQRGLDAQGVEDGRQLDPDIAAADHDQTAGAVLQVLERVIRSDRELEAGQRRHVGPGADRDQDVLRRVGLPVHLDRAGPDHPAATLEHADAGALQHAQVHAVQARDLGVARLDQGAPVMLGRGEPPAIGRRGLEVVGEDGAVAHQLLGDAAADHAGAPDPQRLAQSHFGAIGTGAARAGDAAGAAADHEQIEIRQIRRSLVALPAGQPRRA